MNDVSPTWPWSTSLRRLVDGHGARVCFAAGGLVGLVLALWGLDPAFIAGTGGKWIRPDNDFAAYVVAWNYYIVDGWRFPLFALPAMGYPEGGSVLFNDALPIAALPTRVLYQISGVRVNPFGWWILLTYLLQGAMAARLAWIVGARSVWACAAAATLAIVNTSFGSRMGHTALSSHFLLLWALALHFESLQKSRPKVGELTILLGVTLLVNSYLFAMVLAFQFATTFAIWLRRGLSFADLRNTVLGMLAVAVLGIVAGYGIFLTDPTTMKSQGFGHYSWNLVGLLLPPDGVFGYLGGLPRDGTHGQYEGESYIGRGALFLLVLAVGLAPKRSLAAVRRYWIYVGMLLLFAVYAASNVVYASDVLLFEYPLPPALVDLGNYFRATGRFIWPLAYSLMILPVAAVFRWCPVAVALPAAAFGVYLQLQEAAPSFAWRRHVTSQVGEDLIESEKIGSWLSQHQRIYQFPSWACGGLAGSKRSWGNLEANRELQVQLAAARAGLPTNSVYTSRLLKSCPQESTWATAPSLEPGVLYFLGPETVAASPPLIELSRSNACVTLDWAVVCSRSWSEMAAPVNGGSTVHK